MCEKYSKKIKQYLEDLIEERDNLSSNIDGFVNNVKCKVENSMEKQLSSSEKWAQLMLLQRHLLVLSEANHNLLKAMESLGVELTTRPDTPTDQYVPESSMKDVFQTLPELTSTNIEARNWIEPMDVCGPPTEVPQKLFSDEVTSVMSKIFHTAEQMKLNEPDATSLIENEHGPQPSSLFRVKNEIETGTEPCHSIAQSNLQSATDRPVVDMADSTETSEPNNSNEVESSLNNWGEPKSELECSAVKKLSNVEIMDPDKLFQEQALAEMPDLRLVSSYSSTSSTSNKSERRKRKTINYYLTNPILPEADMVCTFSHIVSPSEFYLIVFNDFDASLKLFEELTTSLSKTYSLYKHSFISKLMACKRIGTFGCGYLKSKKIWCRMKILDWKLEDQDDVTVQAVDYGFKCDIHFKYLRELTKELTKLPIFAVKSHFACLYPMGSTRTNKLIEWNELATGALHSIAGLHLDFIPDFNHCIIFETLIAKMEGDSLEVDLIQTGFNGANKYSVSILLMDMCLAVELFDTQSEQSSSSYDELENFDGARNLGEAIFGYSAKDETRICRFTRNGSCFKGANCKLEHCEQRDGITTDRHSIVCGIQPILPKIGEIVTVILTSYLDSCTYYAHIVKKEVKRSDILTDRTIYLDQNLSNSLDSMNQPKTIAGYQRLTVAPALREMVVFRHPYLQRWMRASVVFVDDGGSSDIELTVFSVDFGGEFSVLLRDVRSIPAEFIQLPPQAQSICLDDYCHDPICCPKSPRKLFEKYMAFQKFHIVPKSMDEPMVVHMTTVAGHEIGPTLVEHGYAKARERPPLTIGQIRVNNRQFALQ